MSRPAWSHMKDCATCSRLMSAEDAHRQCQRCRNGGRWPTGWSADYQRQHRARLALRRRVEVLAEHIERRVLRRAARDLGLRA